jgi:hypothetical protein
MNTITLLLLLSLKPLGPVKEMPLMIAPQVTAPLDVYEDKATLKELKEKNVILKRLKEQV